MSPFRTLANLFLLSSSCSIIISHLLDHNFLLWLVNSYCSLNFVVPPPNNYFTFLFPLHTRIVKHMQLKTSYDLLALLPRKEILKIHFERDMTTGFLSFFQQPQSQLLDTLKKLFPTILSSLFMNKTQLNPYPHNATNVMWDCFHLY